MTIGGCQYADHCQWHHRRQRRGQPETIVPPVQLGATQTWTIGGNSTMTVSGPISGGAALAMTGGGRLLLSGATPPRRNGAAAGTLQVGTANALPADMSVSVTGSGGAVVLSNSLSSAVKLSALTLDGGSSSPQAKFDLGNGELVVDKNRDFIGHGSQ